MSRSSTWPVRRASCLLALWACLFPGMVWAAAGEAPRALQFGVLNQQSVLQTAARWNPLLQYLGRKTGLPLQLRMGATIAQTDAMMGREEFDLAFTNHNFQSEYDGRYRVIARWSGPPVRGVIAVREDSPIRRLEDLQGAALAFPSAEAFLGYAVTIQALKEVGVGVVERFAGNHHGALAQLRAGLVEAVSVNSRFLEDYRDQERIAVRPVFISAPYPDLPVIAHPRLPREQVEAITRALLGMKDDPEGRVVLAQARCAGFDAATDQDYDDVRRIYRAIGQ